MSILEKQRIEGYGGMTGGDGPAPAYIPIYLDDQDFGI